MQISLWVRCVDLQLHVEHCQGVTSQRFKTWGKNDINLAWWVFFPLLSTATTQKTKQTNKQQQQTKEGKRDATAVLRVLPCNESSLALTLEKKTKSLAVNGLLAR